MRASRSAMFPTPPAARSRATENNLAEIMFTGITHYRFFFRWIRKCCRLRAQLLRQTWALRIARRFFSGKRCRAGVSTYTACQTLPGEGLTAPPRGPVSLPVLCPMHIDRVACVPDFLRQGCPAARICSSTRSAVRRSASSRRAIRLPLRKKMFNGALRLPGNIDFAFFQSLAQIVRGKSTSTTSSAASKDRARSPVPEFR